MTSSIGIGVLIIVAMFLASAWTMHIAYSVRTNTPPIRLPSFRKKPTEQPVEPQDIRLPTGV